MLSSSGRYVVTFNGRYTISALRSALDRGTIRTARLARSRRYEVLSRPSARGVSSVRSRESRECCARSLGSHDRKLWLVRDRNGRKNPFTTARSKAILRLHLKLKAIHAAFGSKARVNETVLCEYLRAGYIPAPETIYRTSSSCLRDTCVHRRRSRLNPAATPIPLWRISEVLFANRSLDKRSPTEAAEEMGSHPRKAVVRTHGQRCTVGAFLSGGIDSSLRRGNDARGDAYPSTKHSRSRSRTNLRRSRFARASLAHSTTSIN